MNKPLPCKERANAGMINIIIMVAIFAGLGHYFVDKHADSHNGKMIGAVVGIIIAFLSVNAYEKACYPLSGKPRDGCFDDDEKEKFSWSDFGNLAESAARGATRGTESLLNTISPGLVKTVNATVTPNYKEKYSWDDFYKQSVINTANAWDGIGKGTLGYRDV
jgi:hypothetical protein